MLAANSPLLLLDGFPHALEHAALFERTICPAHAVVFLDIKKDVAVQRLGGKGKCTHIGNGGLFTNKQRA